jgi:hypothetical protein
LAGVCHVVKREEATSIGGAAQEEPAEQSVAVEITMMLGRYSEELLAGQEKVRQLADHPKTEEWQPNQDFGPGLAVGTV